MPTRKPEPREKEMSIFGSSAPRVGDRTVLVVCLVLIAALSWLALWLLDGSAQGFSHHHHHHHDMGGHGASSALVLPLFVGGWTLMTVAMMLPTSIPVVTTFHTIAGQRVDRSLLVTLVVIGYLVAWALFGVLIYLGNLLLQWLVSTSPWLQERVWAGSPALLLLAGLFQFTPLKYRCLDKCRSPLSFVIEHWQGRHDRWQAFRLGVDHGIFCVGCCWALMLLMFAVGVGSLLWMMVLAVVMAIEKNVPWGRRMSAPVGVVLIGWGVALLVLA
jgi:predicted metal-binding membrane protein